jgi:hypothetical protein
MSRHRLLAALAGMALCATLAACSKKEEPPPPTPAPIAVAPTAAPAPFAVAAIDLGKAIGADKKVTESVTVFAPADTIYASVASTGVSPSVTLKARWTYEDGQVVNESSQAIAPTGPAVTEFHIAKPSGWPAGKYQVEISANDAVAGSKAFEVK